MPDQCGHCGLVLPPIRTALCPACGTVLDAALDDTHYVATCVIPAQETRRPLDRLAGELIAVPESAPVPPPKNSSGKSHSATAPVATPHAARTHLEKASTEKLFRPSGRPSIALLCLVDDNGETGEWIRLRHDRYVVGRSVGDILIPHDGAISESHLEISRRQRNGRTWWCVKDLSSSNGTYAKVARSGLAEGQEILIGSRRLRFDYLPHQSAPPDIFDTRPLPVLTRDVLESRLPTLTIIAGPQEGVCFPLLAGDNTIGAASDSHVPLRDDPYVAPRHAKIGIDRHRQWFIEPGRSLNGVWLRITEIFVPKFAELMIGEQRLVLKVGR
jgi:pSer/pThr/pTyr-binding forkhead associated (FHA) protein